MGVFFILAFGVWAGVWFLNLLGVLYVLFPRNSRVKASAGSKVCVLKPLKGIEGALEENLESFFQLKYPDFELWFCVADAKDPVCDLVKALMARHPRVKAHLFIDPDLSIANPKVGNLFKAAERNSDSLLLISDSKARVHKEYLREMVSALSLEKSIVTSPMQAIEGSGLGGLLDMIYLNTVMAKFLPLAHFLRMPVVLGHSMLFRKTEIASFGGLKYIGQFLAEDYALGCTAKKHGFTISRIQTSIQHCIGHESLSVFWFRHLRWARIRKAGSFSGYLTEPVLHALGSGLLGATAFYFFSGSFFLPFIFHCVCWCLTDYLVARRLETDCSFISFTALWLLRESIFPALWLAGLFGSKVIWRGIPLKLKAGGKIDVPDKVTQEDSRTVA